MTKRMNKKWILTTFLRATILMKDLMSQKTEECYLSPKATKTKRMKMRMRRIKTRLRTKTRLRKMMSQRTMERKTKTQVRNQIALHNLRIKRLSM